MNKISWIAYLFFHIHIHTSNSIHEIIQTKNKNKNRRRVQLNISLIDWSKIMEYFGLEFGTSLLPVAEVRAKDRGDDPREGEA